MKKTFLMTVATFAMSGATTIAQPPGGGDRGGDLDDRVERMMNFDENKDGQLSKDEVPERLQSLFARADKDEDGKLNREEISASFEGREGGGREGGGREGGGREGGGREGGGREGGGREGGGREGMPPNPLFMALDTDRNGELSADEINNATASLKKLDRNKNGKLDMAELGPPARGQGGGGRPGEGGPGGGDPVAFMLDRHDSNKDGRLTKDELPEFMQRGMTENDKNEDGVLDRSEIEAMARRFRERGGPGGRGPEGGRGRGEGERGRGEGGERKRPPAEE
jgi:Ca2+-binding EF-hand superfamily protein